MTPKPLVQTLNLETTDLRALDHWIQTGAILREALDLQREASRHLPPFDQPCSCNHPYSHHDHRTKACARCPCKTFIN